MSEKLQAEIKARPVSTFLRNTSTVTEKQYKSALPIVFHKRNIPIPDVFDGRVVWADYLSPIRNQGNCGSCWAFATSSCLADKFNIQSKGDMKIELSPAKMIICDFHGDELKVDPEKHPNQVQKLNTKAIQSGACNGDTLFDAWRYLYLIGTSTEACVPYDRILGKNSTKNLPLCTEVAGKIGDMCANVSYDATTGQESGDPMRLYRSYHFYSIPGVKKDNGDVSNIMYDIYVWGPVTTGITVYSDFYTFDAKNGVYEWDGISAEVGGHAVEIVGWGTNPPSGTTPKGGDFWIIRNSWGEDWGRQGYFFLKKGVNMCGVEENCMTGSPNFFYPASYVPNLPDPFEWTEDIKLRAQRHSLDTDLTLTGGGIDPESGYTRRITATKPWLNFTPEFNYKKFLSYIDTFTAGKVGTKTRMDTQNFLWLLLFVVVICCISYTRDIIEY